MNRLVLHIFHADDASLDTGSHVAMRAHQVAASRGVLVEVYIFGPAEERLLDPSATEFNATIDSLIAAGVPVITCLNTAKGLGAAEAFAARGIQMEYARDAFVRYAAESGTVVSF